MKRILAFLLLTAIVPFVRAQQGYPLLTSFTESRDIENQSWAVCQDANQVMLFANRKGILTFDGQEWHQASVPVIPYAMQKSPTDGKIYVGGENNYGFVERDEKGEYRYTSLSGDSAETGVISRIVFRDSVIWFCSDVTVNRFNPASGKCDLVINSKPGTSFTGMITNRTNTFINVSGEGLYRLEADTLFPIVTGYLTSNVEVLFSLPYDNTNVLVGLSNGKLSLFDGIKYYDYKIRDEGYLDANILSDGIMLGDSAYVFSTLDGGALIVEKLTGKVLYTINNQVGLPDDEIFALGQDKTGGIWLSHQYGLTRADLKLPVATFSTYPGLMGNLSSAMQVNGQLYVATSEGLFYLEEVKNYQDVQVLVKKESSSMQTTQAASVQEKPASRKSIFSKIFGGKSSESTKPQTTAPAAQTAKPVVEYARKTVTTLRSINHVYRKIPGLNEKCRQIVATPGGILVATNKGLFAVTDKQAREIVPDRYINAISWNPVDGKYYVAAGNGYFSVKYEYGKWTADIPDPTFTKPVYSVSIGKDQALWLGSDNFAYSSPFNAGKYGPDYKSYSVQNDFPQRYNLNIIDDVPYLFTESGVYTYSQSGDAFVPEQKIFTVSGEARQVEKPLSNVAVMRNGSSWISADKTGVLSETELSMLRIFNDIVSVTSTNGSIWVVNGDNRLYRIDRSRIKESGEEVEVLVKNIMNDKGIRFGSNNIKFNRGDDIVIFDIVAPTFLQQNTTQYQYFISKAMPGWSEWSDKTHYEKVITRQGEYKLQVRAKDLWGNIGEAPEVTFRIRAPFTETIVFYVLVAGLLLSGFIIIVRMREKQMKEQNRILEEKVKERTAEVVAQKEEITASIEYASRIQMAMLPVEDHFKSVFSDYFILFRPRDIVSGDFYWIGEDQKSVFFTVADCTGHGVPGAFMSAMGISTLNEIIANNDDLKASRVLDLLRQKIKTSLHQTGKEGEAVDGMDIALCVLSSDRKTIQFAGAYNSVVLVSNGEVTEYKGNSMPIGIHYGEEEPFTNHEIRVKKGDSLYLFSDGFSDQFGGPDGTKYKKSNLKKFIGSIYNKPMREQQELLTVELSEWKGSGFQIDDITILGVKI